MNKIIADRMLVDDDELHFRDADAQNKLKNLIVQGKGDSETAVMSQAAATVEFDKLSEDIDNVAEIVGIVLLRWEQGGILSSGVESPPNYDKRHLFVRTADHIDGQNKIKVVFQSTVRLAVHKYDIDNNYIGADIYNESGAISTDGTAYIRLKVYRADETEITPEYVAENVSVIYDNGTTLDARVRTLEGRSKGLEDELSSVAESAGVVPAVWEQGGTYSETGLDRPSGYVNHDKFVRTANYIKKGKEISVVFPPSDRLVVHKYDSEKKHIGAEIYNESGTISTDGTAYIRLKVYRADETEITPEYVRDNVKVFYTNRFAKMKLCTYGDSITRNQAWANIVVDELNIGTLYNRGWSDSAVTMENKTLFINADGTYNSNPITTEQPNGTTEVQCSFCHDDRISYIPLDTDIVLVMGGTNDLLRSKPIGDISNDGNYDESTFVGALISTVRKIQTRLPDANVIIMTPIVNLSSAGAETPTVNKNNDTAMEFAKAVRNVADYIGCNLIDVHNCGITIFNAASKLKDSTHPNNSGAELIAKTVISGLRRIYSLET